MNTPSANRRRIALARAAKGDTTRRGGRAGKRIFLGQRIDRHAEAPPSGRRAEPRFEGGRGAPRGVQIA